RTPRGPGQWRRASAPASRGRASPPRAGATRRRPAAATLWRPAGPRGRPPPEVWPRRSWPPRLRPRGRVPGLDGVGIARPLHPPQPVPVPADLQVRGRLAERLAEREQVVPGRRVPDLHPPPGRRQPRPVGAERRPADASIEPPERT